MPSYHTYLISSLPMLQFSAKQPLNLEDFFSRCSQLIPAEEVELIKKVVSEDAYALDVSSSGVIKGWRDFDLILRNELVKLRAVRKKTDALKFLRKDAHFDMELTRIAQAALRQHSILEAEKFLDLERWKKLEQLAQGHYFDLDFLLVYALKLSILERWSNINNSDKTKTLEKVLGN